MRAEASPSRQRTRWSRPTARCVWRRRAGPSCSGAQVLLQYPTLWWAGMSVVGPLHVSAARVEGVGVVLAGPGGVGKSTLVAASSRAARRATCDNLGAYDGDDSTGCPNLAGCRRRGDGEGAAPDQPHGRREQPWETARYPTLRPRPGRRRSPAASGPDRAPGPAGVAARALVAGTYAAGELRRYWALAADAGPGHRARAHPAVGRGERRRVLTSRLPCFGAASSASTGPVSPLRARRIARGPPELADGTTVAADDGIQRDRGRPDRDPLHRRAPAAWPCAER